MDPRSNPDCGPRVDSAAGLARGVCRWGCWRRSVRWRRLPLEDALDVGNAVDSTQSVEFLRDRVPALPGHGAETEAGGLVTLDEGNLAEGRLLHGGEVRAGVEFDHAAVRPFG